jgi:hypothetical protein
MHSSRIATGHEMDGRGSIPGRERASKWALGSTHPPIKWILAALLQGVKQPERDANHSLASSAEAKKYEAIPPLPLMSSWHSAYVIKNRYNFAFVLK